MRVLEQFRGQQLTSSMRQMQTLALLSRDLYKKSVVPIVRRIKSIGGTYRFGNSRNFETSFAR